ncbi:ROK family transcriptional regulator [Stigmatella aurantiaca]|nr:ROK family transcriptional regulator [Stigmatella aurantiaca]
MNSSSIRRLNRVRVFHALRQNPGSSQRELGRLTGLDKATVSVVVAQLQQEGLIERMASTSVRRVGRPETALTIAASAGVLVGARLEPKTIRMVATTLAGEILAHMQIDGSRNVRRAITLLQKGIQELLTQAGENREVRGIGVGIPGMMNREGRLVLAPNLGWRNSEIRPMLEENLNAPVYVDNDTNAASVAECLFGICRTVRNFIFITGHSGVGGGLVLDGRLYRGTGGFAGEVGHLSIVPGGRACGCGKRGCLETYVSEASILARLEELGRTLPDIWAVAEAQGDPKVRQVLDEVGTHLGFALSHLVNLMNPELIVLGGNLAVIAQLLMPTLKRALAEHTLRPLLEDVRLEVSPLGADAVPMGGIALALEGFLTSSVVMAEERSQRRG